MKNKLLRNIKILLVEDEEKLSIGLKNAIGDNFFSFSVAKDGLEGIEKFEKISPDIVITDINMPNLDGLEMSNRLKVINPSIPIIILSAFSEKEKLFSAIDVGVTKYFLKPYDPGELLEYIESIAPTLGAKTIELSDGFVFNKTTSALYKNNRFVSLSKNEIKFLVLLLKNKDEPVNEMRIKLEIWDEDVSDDRLRTFIKRFRAKTSKNLIKNIKGVGYKLEV